jgi:eukaryotic-like serine/threonine-protein kinase
VTTNQLSQAGLLWEADGEIDPALAERLESYLSGLEQGLRADREAFLAQHPQHAAQLASYLPWVEMLCQAKPRGDDTTANPPMPGRLGDFRIIREIGRGGMGVVYEAEQLSLERRVALKVLPFASMLDERQLARFKNEGLAAAQLQHPHIVPVFAVGCERGLHFYVMQLIEGQTLEQLIHDRSISGDTTPTRNATITEASAEIPASSAAPTAGYRELVEWIVQAADALDHAHDQGVVHRDIKPSNLMICGEGMLWVTDFGLARTTRDSVKTASGELLGTLRYMSPEQLRSKPGIVDHRTDIYSLGLTLYELVAGRPGFDGQSHQELMRQIEQDELPSLVRLDTRVPRDLDSIVAMATAKAPEARYASARDLTDDLRAFLDGRPTVARPATLIDHCDKWIRRHARLVAAAGVALTLIMICAVISAALVWRAQTATQRALTLASDNHQRAAEHLQDARHAVDDVFTGIASDLTDIPGAERVRHRLLTQALSYYQKFIAQPSSDATVRAETASAYYRCGQINEQLGDDEAACVAYGGAKQLWLALQSEDGGEHQSQPLSLCENNLGLIHLRAGRIREAESHLRAAMELHSQLVKRRPEDAVQQRSLALSYANLGAALGLGGQPVAARKYLQRAIDVQLSADAKSPQQRGDLAATYNQLGYVCSKGSVADAEAAYRQAASCRRAASLALAIRMGHHAQQSRGAHGHGRTPRRGRGRVSSRDRPAETTCRAGASGRCLFARPGRIAE